MTSTVEIVRSEGVGEKRHAVDDDDADVSFIEDGVLPPPVKRSKRDLKKVAEMVLVLAAMGKMRGGRGPTDAEKELMEEARNRLGKVCEGFAPKDVFPREALGGVIEDLGLNKLKDQRIGFRPPKISIADKLLLSRRKMEKAEELSVSTQRLGPSGAAVESQNASHPAQIFHLAKSNQFSISAGHVKSASSLGHVPISLSATLPYQLPTSEIRPIANPLPSSQLGSSALPRVDRPHPRLDGRSNGVVPPSHVQVTHSVDSTSRTATWSFQPQSVSSAKARSDNKMPVHMSLKVEATADAKSGLPTQAMSRTVQTTGPPSRSINYVQAPHLGNAHAEIVKIVQKLLQPRISERPIWNPPSRDYMSKALTCQMCMSTVTDIDSIIICDACEKGYHLKCLEMTNQRGSKAEWHCAKCLSFSNGKPLPPKYGRVMRNANTSKVSSDSPAVPSTSVKKIGASDEKVGQPKIMTNGNISPQNVPSGVADNNTNHQIPKRDVQGIQENDNVSSMGKIDNKMASAACPNNLMKLSFSGCVSPVDSSAELARDKKLAEPIPNSSAEIEMVPSSSDKSQVISLSDKPQVIVSAQDGNLRLLNDEASSLKQSLETHGMVGEARESHGVETSSKENQLKEHGVRNNISEIATCSGIMDSDTASSDGLHAVNWVGEPIKVLDDKIYYSSCHINGHLYKVMDHVIIRSENEKLIPSKLQAMWEDKNTIMKWVTVNQCYFPGDLPEAVGRPCGLESREVYESTSCRTLMAGLIESPCEVYPPRKFEEESERRAREGEHDGSPPLYLCKWIYDEEKALFRDISC